MLVDEIAHDHPDMAIVLVTGVDDPDVAKRAFEMGAHGYLVKPSMPGQLQITTMNALRQRELELAQKAHSKALEDRLQVLMDRAPVPIYIKDRDRRYVLANRVAHEAAGLTVGELVGLRDVDIMPVEAERQVAESDRRILEHGESYEAEETLRVGDRQRTFLTVKFPFVDDEGKISGISGISTDITEKKQAETLRERARRGPRAGDRGAAGIAPGNGRATCQGDRDARRRDGRAHQSNGLGRRFSRPQGRARPRSRIAAAGGGRRCTMSARLRPPTASCGRKDR
jgi:PAS domain S-box-containing protein